MDNASNLSGEQFPKLYYHKSRRSRYTLKSDLKKLNKSENESGENSSGSCQKRIRNVENTSKLAIDKSCIFCDTENKFVNEKQGKLYNCSTSHADETTRECARIKNDKRILAMN